MTINAIKCTHGKTIFEDCDDCEIIWLKNRIALYERKLREKRRQLNELEKRTR